MNVLKYISDSSASWSCLTQLADLPKQYIMGTPYNKPDLSALGYSLEIITACKNGKINKSKFKLKNYASTCVHNEMLDEKERQKRDLTLIDATEIENGASCPAGCYYEGKTDEYKRSIPEDEKISAKITIEDCFKQIEKMTADYKKTKGINLSKTVSLALEGYTKSIKTLNTLMRSDSVLKQVVTDLVEAISIVTC